MMSTSCSLSFLIATGIVKKLLKTARNKKKKYNKMFMLARSKLNSIESKISEALINDKTSHEHFMTIINEDRELKENIRMMNSQRRDVEKKDLIKEGINPTVSNTSNGKTMTLSKCAICDSRKSRFITNQEANRLLSNLGIDLVTKLSKVPLLGDILF